MDGQSMKACRRGSTSRPAAARVTMGRARRRWLGFCLATLVLPSAGCGGAPTRPAAQADATTQTSPRGPDHWQAMNFVERHGVMSWTVLPNMAQLFQHFGSTTYPELACVKCHGADAEARRYTMSASLPALSDADVERAAHVAANARGRDRTLRFMRDEVVPRFDHLIEGGGRTTCFSCHRHAEEAVAP